MNLEEKVKLRQPRRTSPPPSVLFIVCSIGFLELIEYKNPTRDP